MVQAINARLAAISDTTTTQGEALTILRYAPGQRYRAHLDALPGAANQRAWTALVYLNEGYGGGETDFPRANVRVRGSVGDVLLFRNLDRNGAPATLALHEGLPITAGHKWLASRWIRERPLDLWTIER